MMTINTPHISLGISLSEGIEILEQLDSKIEQQEEKDSTFYKVGTEDFECGFYEKDGIIVSSWYNDPTGRDSQEGINQKVSLYLARYGDINDWEEGINNGWIQFFFNEKASVGMAYGIHKDVIRFNSH